MTILTCPITGCGFQTDDLDVIGAAAVLNVHAHAHAASTPASPSTAARAPKLERPRIGSNATTEEWNAFLRRWNTFRLGSGITDDSASAQLLECAHLPLADIILRAYPTFTTQPLPDALRVLKSMAVVPVALGVLRADLAAMRQDPDESFRTFAARVQGKAETCEFRVHNTTTCTTCQAQCQGDVYYTDDMVRDVLLNGISDMDIRREALSAEGMQAKPVNAVIAFVESRETARNANQLNVSSVSTYRRLGRDTAPPADIEAR